MTVTTFKQTQHPEIGAKVTQISQEVVYDNFEIWYKECKKFQSECNFHHSLLTFSTFKNYFKQGLTPLQAVKKYFL